MRAQQEKARAFRALHEASAVFVMPNAWDAGSAKILASLGFPAIATTSAGAAFTLGRPDGEVSREEALRNARDIADAVELPVSIDLEDGYGPSPEDAARTIAASATTGAVGGSIEDATGDRAKPLYEFDLAVERMRAARDAADRTGIPYTLTGRAECFLVGHSDPLRESIRRLRAYAEAGAHCLYAPGIGKPEDIRALVREVPAPVNVLIGGTSKLTVGELAEMGVRRISVGGGFARVAYSAALEVARTLAGGRFDFGKTLSLRTFNEFFAGRGKLDG
jgi:2-methylisocitrate lyase-like PEP mutase family enzyme